MAGIPLNFDTAAAGRPNAHLAQWYAELLPKCYLNPHGGTIFSERIRRQILDCERRLLRTLEIPQYDAYVIWTSGITEALNLATLIETDTILLDPGAHAALSAPALSNVSNIENLTVAHNGKLGIPEKLSAGRCLVGLSHVNNETGVMQDLPGIRSQIGSRNLMLVDAAQSFCRLWGKWACQADVIALSSRKIGGPASVGALVIRKNRICFRRPLIVGGGQQKGMRSGTLDACGIEMFVRTAEDQSASKTASQKHLAKLNQCFLQEYTEFRNCRSAELVGDSRDSHIHMLLMPGYEGAVVSRILADTYGIMVASSSACSAENGKGSATMLRMGYSNAESMQAIRISLDDQIVPEDITRLFAALKNTLDNF